MSMWTSVVSKVKRLKDKMIRGNTIEQQLNVSYAVSPQMEKAIRDWSNLYKNKAPWLHEPDDDDPTRIVSLGLPSMIASEKARMALLEFESEITAPTEDVEVPNPDYPGEQKVMQNENGEEIPLPQQMPPETIKETRPVGNTERAEYLESQYKKLKKQLRKQIEYGIAKGGLVIKPYIITNESTGTEFTTEENTDGTSAVLDELEHDTIIQFDFIQADAFYPLAFNAAEKITEAVFIQTKVETDAVYRRLEYHKWENNVATIINKAYRSTNLDTSMDMHLVDLGKEINLTEVQEWKDLAPETTIKNVEQPLFAYFKMPEANIIDTTSPLGVSGFSRAVPLIHDADMQYSRLLWEYEGGEMAIDIDRDALYEEPKLDGTHRTKPNHLQKRLFRRVDLGTAETYQQFAPALRDASYIQGLNVILMRIEDTCGISRGTLSDNTVEVARTATELKILKQRSYQTNAEIQSAIEEALREVIYIMNVYCTLYDITPDGEYDVSFEWDDSIITDIDTELEKRLLLLQNAITSKKELRMWYFGETDRQAEEALTQIQEELATDRTNENVYQYSESFRNELNREPNNQPPKNNKSDKETNKENEDKSNKK